MTAEEKKKLIQELVNNGMTPDEAAKKVAELEQAEKDQAKKVAEAEQKTGEKAQPEQSQNENEGEKENEQSGQAQGDVEEARGEEANTPADVAEPNPEAGSATPANVLIEDLQRRLFESLVLIDGRLADPKDLPFDAALLDDPKALEAAITALIAKKPGLRKQQLAGNIGAGKVGDTPKAKPDLIKMIRGY